MTVWRLQTLTGGQGQHNIGQFCLDNSVVAMGWSLESGTRERLLAQYPTPTIDQYKKSLEKDIGTNRLPKNLNNFLDISQDDIVWMRSKGVYYFCRIDENAHWKYDSIKAAYENDACNQWANVKWIQAGDESDIPGAVATAFIRGMVCQRIRKEGIEEFSQNLYNQKEGVYYNVTVGKTQETFYNYLSPSDCEDLLALWLNHKYGYIVVPSTNKQGTELYEFVLIQPKTGGKAFVQVKKGNNNLNKNDYISISTNGEVWLMTTQGKFSGNGNTRIHEINNQELFDFAMDLNSVNYLSEAIKRWVNLIR
jgi:hypothetical protein